jgi:adenylate cyclase
MEPTLLVGLLDQYFTAFDDTITRYGLEMVKTIGDAYMAVGGVLETDHRHPVSACLAALQMREKVAAIRSRRKELGLPALELRIGIHSGPVVSGVIGVQRFTFDTWGEAVNKASFMETHCPAGRINISEAVARRVESFFELESRGSVAVKHARMHRMYFLNRSKPEFSHDHDGPRLNENSGTYLSLNAVAGHARSRMPLPCLSSCDLRKR